MRVFATRRTRCLLFLFLIVVVVLATVVDAQEEDPITLLGRQQQQQGRRRTLDVQWVIDTFLGFFGIGDGPSSSDDDADDEGTVEEPPPSSTTTTTGACTTPYGPRCGPIAKCIETSDNTWGFRCVEMLSTKDNNNICPVGCGRREKCIKGRCICRKGYHRQQDGWPCIENGKKFVPIPATAGVASFETDGTGGGDKSNSFSNKRTDGGDNNGQNNAAAAAAPPRTHAPGIRLRIEDDV